MNHFQSDLGIPDSNKTNHALMQYRNDKNKDADFKLTMRIVELFEYMGLLCRKKYISANDLYEFFGGSIKVYYDLFKPYYMALQARVAANNRLSRERGEPEIYKYPKAIFANAIWLGEEMAHFKPYEFDETPAPL